MKKNTATMHAAETAMDSAKAFMKTKKGKTIGLIAVLAAIGTAATLFIRARRAR